MGDGAGEGEEDSNNAHKKRVVAEEPNGEISVYPDATACSGFAIQYMRVVAFAGRKQS